MSSVGNNRANRFVESNVSTRHGRRRAFALLLAAFILVPVVEIWVIIQIGHVIGPWWTVLLLIADALFGSWLVRHEGRRAWLALRTALQEGRMPSNELADGMLLLIGGTLMLAPGFVTDLFGAVLILPITRPLGRRLLARALARRLAGPGGSRRSPRPGHDDVIPGEVLN